MLIGCSRLSPASPAEPRTRPRPPRSSGRPGVGRAPDVVVVGGGIVGTATAAFLAEAGARVVLVERDTIAAGASGRNSGVIQQPLDPVLAALYRDSLRLYRDLAAASSGTFTMEARPAGLLYATLDRDVAAALAAELAAEDPQLEP